MPMTDRAPSLLDRRWMLCRVRAIGIAELVDARLTERYGNMLASCALADKAVAILRNKG